MDEYITERIDSEKEAEQRNMEGSRNGTQEGRLRLGADRGALLLAFFKYLGSESFRNRGVIDFAPIGTGLSSRLFFFQG